MKRNTVIKTENLEERNRKLVAELEEVKAARYKSDKEKKVACKELEEVKKQLEGRVIDEEYEVLEKVKEDALNEIEVLKKEKKE